MWARFIECLGKVWRASGIPAAARRLERRMAMAVRREFGGAGYCAWCGEQRTDCDVCRK